MKLFFTLHLKRTKNVLLAIRQTAFVAEHTPISFRYTVFKTARLPNESTLLRLGEPGSRGLAPLDLPYFQYISLMLRE